MTTTRNTVIATLLACGGSIAIVNIGKTDVGYQWQQPRCDLVERKGHLREMIRLTEGVVDRLERITPSDFKVLQSELRGSFQSPGKRDVLERNPIYPAFSVRSAAASVTDHLTKALSDGSPAVVLAAIGRATFATIVLDNALDRYVEIDETRELRNVDFDARRAYANLSLLQIKFMRTTECTARLFAQE